MRLDYIHLKPFSYEAAASLVRHYTGDTRIMLDPQVQYIVSQLSDVPGYLVSILDTYKSTGDWAQSLAILCNTRVYRCAGGICPKNTYKLFTMLIACSITQLPFPFSEAYQGVADLEACELCWVRENPLYTDLSVPSDGVLVGVPYVALLSRAPEGGWYPLGRPYTDGLTYETAFTEALSIICRDSLSLPSYIPKSVAITMLTPAYLSLNINGRGILYPASRHYALSWLLSGAYLCSAAREVSIQCQPIVVCIQEYSTSSKSSDHSYDPADEVDWEQAEGCFTLIRSDTSSTSRADGQCIVDSYTLFKDVRMNGITFDLFLFAHSKRDLNSTTGDLDSTSTYTQALYYSREVVSRYQAQTNRTAGFIYGVTDPLQPLSKEVKSVIDQLSSAERLEFLYAMGRSECIVHYDLLAAHPALVPRVYINQRDLDATLLASALPSSWTHRAERAKALLTRRSEGEYCDWGDLIARAGLALDPLEGGTQLEIPSDSAICFY